MRHPPHITTTSFALTRHIVGNLVLLLGDRLRSRRLRPVWWGFHLSRSSLYLIFALIPFPDLILNICFDPRFDRSDFLGVMNRNLISCSEGWWIPWFLFPSFLTRTILYKKFAVWVRIGWFSSLRILYFRSDT